MRKQTWCGSLAILGLLVAGLHTRAYGQLGGAGPYQPPVSPYMNINRLGANPAVNWFTIVQPQLEFNQAIGQLQAQQGNLAQVITGTLTGQTTGHPIMFNNYLHYYSIPHMRGGMAMMARGGMGMGGRGRGGMGYGGMGMGMGMGGMGYGGMGMGMGMGGMGYGGMGYGGMGMGGMGMYGR